jgi:hypothetical protein
MERHVAQYALLDGLYQYSNHQHVPAFSLNRLLVPSGPGGIAWDTVKNAKIDGRRANPVARNREVR